MELEQRAAGSFSYDADRGVVSLVWADTPLDEEAVKEMLVRFGEHAKAHPDSSLLVDARSFKFQWGPEMDAWRDEFVMPVYNEAKVRKFAFVFPEFVPESPPSRTPPANFETGAFHTIDDAQDWLAGE
jgi:hypothetical protein